jgi:hypothetical protein
MAVPVLQSMAALLPAVLAVPVLVVMAPLRSSLLRMAMRGSALSPPAAAAAAPARPEVEAVAVSLEAPFP